MSTFIIMHFCRAKPVMRRKADVTERQCMLCRRGFLQKAFQDEFRYESGRSQSRGAQNNTNKAVRPGSFLTCLTATQFEMNNLKEVDASLARIETIRKEAMQTLEILAD